jgi:hypothetical protein
VTEDATLPDFADGTDGDPADRQQEPSDGAASASEDDDDADGAGTNRGDVGFSTYAWGEYACSRCERTTDRVWRADGEFVCPDCKDW